MKKIEIEIPDGKRAEWVDGVLKLVDEKPKDVTERIKTFEDAVRELGSGHSFVKEYKALYQNNFLSTDILAYLKLRIVCAALNEGWKPEFAEKKYRCYPWFIMLTKTDIENISEKENYVMIDTDYYDTEYAYIAYSHTSCIPLNTTAASGSRLCLKNFDLAMYCGKQFINLWADYMLSRK